MATKKLSPTITGRYPYTTSGAWQHPGAPLDVTCWCERSARPFTPREIIAGEHGWSCGSRGCEPIR